MNLSGAFFTLILGMSKFALVFFALFFGMYLLVRAMRYKNI